MVHQGTRLAPTEEPDDDDVSEFLRQREIDLHFLLVGLQRIRRAALIAAECASSPEELHQAIADFDAVMPGLWKMRSVGEHFDSYERGNGFDKTVADDQLHVWSMSTATGTINWEWLGEKLTVPDAVRATKRLAMTIFQSQPYSGIFERQELEAQRAEEDAYYLMAEEDDDS